MLVLSVAAALSIAPGTDFGVRTLSPVSPATEKPTRSPAIVNAAKATSPNLSLAAQIGARFGRVTSTWRSAARNRKVGGVANSWHLSGRAIDIARNPRVNHAMLANALRSSGFLLIESLDEGDHSHFAFGTPGLALKSRSLEDRLNEVRQEASFFTFRRVPLARR